MQWQPPVLPSVGGLETRGELSNHTLHGLYQCVDDFAKVIAATSDATLTQRRFLIPSEAILINYDRSKQGRWSVTLPFFKYRPLGVRTHAPRKEEQVPEERLDYFMHQLNNSPVVEVGTTAVDVNDYLADTMLLQQAQRSQWNHSMGRTPLMAVIAPEALDDAPEMEDDSIRDIDLAQYYFASSNEYIPFAKSVCTLRTFAFGGQTHVLGIVCHVLAIVDRLGRALYDVSGYWTTHDRDARHADPLTIAPGDTIWYTLEIACDLYDWVSLKDRFRLHTEESSDENTDDYTRFFRAYNEERVREQYDNLKAPLSLNRHFANLMTAHLSVNFNQRYETIKSLRSKDAITVRILTGHVRIVPTLRTDVLRANEAMLGPLAQKMLPVAQAFLKTPSEEVKEGWTLFRGNRNELITWTYDAKDTARLQSVESLFVTFVHYITVTRRFRLTENLTRWIGAPLAELIEATLTGFRTLVLKLVFATLTTGPRGEIMDALFCHFVRRAAVYAQTKTVIVEDRVHAMQLLFLTMSYHLPFLTVFEKQKVLEEQYARTPKLVERIIEGLFLNLNLTHYQDSERFTMVANYPSSITWDDLAWSAAVFSDDANQSSDERQEQMFAAIADISSMWTPQAGLTWHALLSGELLYPEDLSPFLTSPMAHTTTLLSVGHALFEEIPRYPQRRSAFTSSPLQGAHLQLTNVRYAHALDIATLPLASTWQNGRAKLVDTLKPIRRYNAYLEDRMSVGGHEATLLSDPLDQSNYNVMQTYAREVATDHFYVRPAVRFYVKQSSDAKLIPAAAAAAADDDEETLEEDELPRPRNVINKLPEVNSDFINHKQAASVRRLLQVHYEARFNRELHVRRTHNGAMRLLYPLLYSHYASDGVWRNDLFHIRSLRSPQLTFCHDLFRWNLFTHLMDYHLDLPVTRFNTLFGHQNKHRQAVSDYYHIERTFQENLADRFTHLETLDQFAAHNKQLKQLLADLTPTSPTRLHFVRNDRPTSKLRYTLAHFVALVFALCMTVDWEILTSVDPLLLLFYLTSGTLRAGGMLTQDRWRPFFYTEATNYRSDWVQLEQVLVRWYTLPKLFAQTFVQADDNLVSDILCVWFYKKCQDLPHPLAQHRFDLKDFVITQHETSHRTAEYWIDSGRTGAIPGRVMESRFYRLPRIDVIARQIATLWSDQMRDDE